MIIEEELNQVRMEQQEEWEMAKHNLKMAKKTLSQESLSRSDYTIRNKWFYKQDSNLMCQIKDLKLFKNLLILSSFCYKIFTFLQYHDQQQQ